jgi:hypothetical protein
MKFLFYCISCSFLFSSCTLDKEEFINGPITKTIDLSINYSITGDDDTTNYIVILLKDTNDLHNQTPVVYGNSSHLTFPLDTSQKGYWILFKKWDANDVVYESKPLYISFHLIDSSKISNIKLNESIAVKARKVIYELKNVSFNISENYDYNIDDYIPWDKNKLDDAVSGPLPDVYFKLNDFFSTGYTDFIDQPLGRFSYKFHKTIIPSSLQTLTLTCYDYDFNVSPDDVMFTIFFDVNPVKYQVSATENGISKDFSINGYNDYYNSYSDPNPELSIKFY